MKIYEKSSGGIVYRKNGLKIEILLLEWRNSKEKIEYVIPKGHMEWEETAAQAALRETIEETGLPEEHLEIVKFVSKLNYSFTAGYLKNTPLIDKDVYLFLIKYTGSQKPQPQKEERFVGHRWIDIRNLRDIGVKFDIHTIVRKNKIYFI